MDRKQYPRVPLRITMTDFKECPHATQKYTIIERCLNCGVVSKSYMEGTLTRLSEEMNFQVTLFERINCEAYVQSDVFSNQGHLSLGYRKKDDNVFYHFVIADMLHFEDIQQINGKQVYKGNLEQCLERDLDDVDNLYKLDIKSRRSLRKVHDISIDDISIDDIKKSTFRLYYYTYHCKKTGFTKIIVPIHTGLNRKAIMGMLVIGQILIGTNVEKQKEIKGHSGAEERQKNNLFTSIDDFFSRLCTDGKKNYGEALYDFIDRMHQRVKLSRREYLFVLQEELLDRYAIMDSNPAEESDEWLNNIVRMFKDIAKRFAIKRCLLFIPDLFREENLFSRTCRAIEISCDNSDPVAHVETSNIMIDINRINEIDRSNYIVSIEKLSEHDCLHGFTITEENKPYLSFYRWPNSRPFLGVLLEWNDLWYDDIKNDNGDSDDGHIHDVFFRSLLSYCHAIVATRVAWLKEKALEKFSYISIHDLAQKAFILNIHNTSFKDDINQAYDKGVFEVEALRKQDGNDARKEFLKRCEIYNKQMQYCATAMEYIRRVLKRGDLYEIPKLESPYNPVKRFFKNFHQHYNSPYYEFRGQKHLNIKWPYGDIRYMNADSVMIERALSNLIDNAFKFAYERTYIYINYTVEGKNHVFRVTNYCSGIKPEITEEIFEYKRRGDNNIPGQGIGLCAAREYAEKHGGTLELECGIRGDEKSLKSKKNLNFLQILEGKDFFFRREDETEIENLQKELLAERDRLRKFDEKDLSKINLVAIKEGRKTEYDEIYLNKDIDRGWEQLLDESLLKVFSAQTTFPTIRSMSRLPTYAVTFRLSIPDDPVIKNKDVLMK